MNTAVKKKFKVIGLIPAKKNSKDLKDKNFKKLNGLSLFEIAIKGSINSKIIKETFVTSDSLKILKIAEKYGAKSILRNKKLSSFKATAEELILDFLKKNINNYKDEELIIVYLQPTSPFRNHTHIDSAFKIFLREKIKILLSVSENKNFYKSFKKNKNKLSPFFKSKLITANRQTLKQIYTPNGAIYIFYAKDFLYEKKFNLNNTDYFLMNKIDSIDIDSKEDYKIAKLLSKKYLRYKL